jgi:cbb3-type cytochrome c oxidase subunit III
VAGSTLAAAHKPVGHDPADLGCTVCHGGQGHATEQDDAHGDVHFWPSPMIPARYAYAGCGSCHTHVRVPNASALEHGRNLFQSLDCLSCHKLDGRGGTLRVGGMGGMEGPDLSRVGVTGYDTSWCMKHQAKANTANETLWYHNFSDISAADQADLAVFLDSRAGAPGLVEAKALFHSLGCRGCHKVNGVGGDDGPDLTRAGERDPGRTDFSRVPGEPTLANWFAEHFRDPAKVVPGSAMPALGLTEEQIDQLTFYTLSLRHSVFPEAYWPKDRIRAERFGEREFATDGATLYGTFCAACHGTRGEGKHFPATPFFPAVANRDFLSLASDDFLAATVTHGRPGRRMPAWGEKEGGLRPDEVKAVVGYLRQLGGVVTEPDPKPARWAKGDPEAGRRLYAAHCSGCHGARGQGGESLALNNRVFLASATDTYLVQTIRRGRSGTAMQSFEQASTTHPAFSLAEIEALVSFIRTWEPQS